MSKKILVIGSSNTDMVVKSEKIPKPGETILGGKFFMNPGGKGANQAVAASKSGASVSMIARVGSDQYGEKAIKALADKGINTDSMHVVSDAPTGIASITVNEAGENSIVVFSGANGTLTAVDIDQEIHLFLY